MGLINEKTTVLELLDEFPETLPLFRFYGFSAETREKLLESVGKKSSLKIVLTAKKINNKIFIDFLNEALERYDGCRNYNDKREERYLDFLGYFPCTSKQYFKDAIGNLLLDYKKATGISLKCDIPIGCETNDKYSNIWVKKNIKDFPDMIISMGYGDFFRKKFIDKFIKSGLFKSVLPLDINPDFVKSGLIDPACCYTIYMVQPYIFLIDKLKLAKLPMPHSWKDLLSPIYENNINIEGHGDKISEAFLLHYLIDYGEEAIKRFAFNTKNIWHGIDIIKHIGTNSYDSAAINVMPHFLVSEFQKKDFIDIIFPDDGVVADSYFMLVKKKAEERVRPIIDYLFSESTSEYLVKQNFSIISGNIRNPFYDGKIIKWQGWDYVRSNDILKIKNRVEKYFISMWQQKVLSGYGKVDYFKAI